jgi:hypothetical protein
MFEKEDRRLPRRAAPFLLLLLGLAVAIGAAYVVVRGRAKPETTRELADGELLAPIHARADPATGEETAPFQGFAVSVETEPAGALVSVAGVPKGESPAFAGVDCVPSQDVEVAIERRGFQPARRTTRCRANTLVKLSIRLQPVGP